MNAKVLTNASAADRSRTDFYPTPTEVTQALLNFLKIPPYSVIWEPACGEGHMSEVFKSNGYVVLSSDLYKTGYGQSGVDFLRANDFEGYDWIITNPPFKLSEQFIEQCIAKQKPFALLLKSQYWHSKRRKALFEKHRPMYILPLTWRPDFLFGAKGSSPTMECIWTVWDSIPASRTEYTPIDKPIIRGGKDDS